MVHTIYRNHKNQLISISEPDEMVEISETDDQCSQLSGSVFCQKFDQQKVDVYCDFQFWNFSYCKFIFWIRCLLLMKYTAHIGVPGDLFHHLQLLLNIYRADYLRRLNKVHVRFCIKNLYFDHPFQHHKIFRNNLETFWRTISKFFKSWVRSTVDDRRLLPQNWQIFLHKCQELRNRMRF